MISVFKFCVIWGIFLSLFADSLLFDMMIKTVYKDGVNTIQDLIDKDMLLGNIDFITIVDNIFQFFIERYCIRNKNPPEKN